ncbi:MPN551 family DNA-binding protein [Mycoplasma bradburyae]|uniref:YqaJ viral recombinase domain-containing protein n=1 Tax=Mycoplasma bradburyae TaxID=2963128 RepID=A0AAW6HRN0_9MOLU|nr:hypothetical protein [Mycoplasma bradburyae]MDC4183491.1 hypothetical protein [Mycoplasma bradburyae]
MPFKKELITEDNFKIDDGQIILSEQFKKTYSSRFKKITGSRFPTILGVNAFSTPFMEWLKMVNLYYETMDPILSNAGVIIEPKIRDYVVDKFNINYKSYEPKEVGFDLFKDNDIFGGIPDGEPVNENGKIIYDENHPMLEIKTTSIDKLSYKKVDGTLRMMVDETGLPIVKEKRQKYFEWYDENNNIKVKKEYILQLSLYLYLRNASFGRFAIIFLRPEDYKTPEAINIDKRLIEIVDMNVNRASIEPYIKQAKQWYENHILTGISPKMTSTDIEFLKSHKII